jgi:hypothetical protein
MMTDEQRDTRALRRFAQSQPIGVRVSERLLDQHGNSRRDAFETLLDVHLVGRRAARRRRASTR